MKTTRLVLFLALIWTTAVPCFAQGTAFTYQGQLQNNGAPANGSFDLAFTLFNAGTNGNVVAGPVTNTGTAVSNGLFTVTLDFGPGVFTGSNYWLQVAVRTNGGSGFTTLTPLQPVMSSPYALYAPTAGAAMSAMSVQASNINGTMALGQLPVALLTNNAVGITLTGAFSGNGGGLTNLNATNLNNVSTVVMTNVYSTGGTNSFTVPVGVTTMVVKLWGAGGSGGEGGSTGGGGAFVMSTLSVTEGETYVVVTGKGGQTGCGTCGGVGSNDGAGGAGGFGGGSGGQASSLFKFTGSTYIMKAVAGGGGGGSVSGGYNLRAGAGGNPGQSGEDGAQGGYNGLGGGLPRAASSYSTNATSVGETNLNLMGGVGGNGGQDGGQDAGGGGGGGYGGGAAGQVFQPGAGGGSYGNQIIGGYFTTPGNTNDADYVAPTGQGTSYYTTAGGDGLVVVRFIRQLTTNQGLEQALAFSGDGSLLTNLNASQISSGTFKGNGVGLTNVTASGLAAGVSITNATISGNGAGLTNLTATNLTGVLLTNQLPTNVALLNVNQTFTGANNFAGTNQTTFKGIYAHGGAPGANGINNNGYAFWLGGDTDSGMYSLGDGQLNFFANAVDTLDITPNAVTISGTVSNGGYGFYSLGGFYTIDRNGASNGMFALYSHSQRAYLWSSVAGADRFSVDTNGNVRAVGTFTASTTPDIAETIHAAGDVEAGDIVCADPAQRESVIRCGRNGRGILGVISDGSGGFLINAHGNSVEAPLTGKPLVLAGRVPVKVSLENGPIHIGDALAPSSIPGAAMRANGSGPTIGTALDNFTGADLKPGAQTGTVLCFVKVNEGAASNDAQQMREMLSERDARIESLEKAVSELKAAISQMGVRQQNGSSVLP